MSDEREDIRNLFHAQGLTGGYREFGERPAAPRPAVPPQAPPKQPSASEHKTRRLDLVRSTTEAAPQEAPPPSPLQGLFDRLAALGGRETRDSEDGAIDLMHMPLEELFGLLESRGGRQ